MREEKLQKLYAITNDLESEADKASDKATDKLFELFPDGIELPREDTFVTHIDGKDYVIKGMNEDSVITYDGEVIDWGEMSRWDFLELLHRMLFALEDKLLAEED